ncbi:hypothetical protein [Streptomyces sp. I6]|uniref:hypothetical protein n=1 Tax=Streptomyces sp. I6 TaxID=2483113 RepID=UPI0028806D26|nr:hypothetical protein [Streptomyces sp. I6]
MTGPNPVDRGKKGTDLAPYVNGWLLLPQASTLLLLLGLTVLVVAMGSLAPARRAAKMSPTDAMKDW